MIYKVRRGVESYGHAIGILLIDCSTPFIPGDVGNASTYNYPVIYKTVPGVTLERLINKGDLSLTEKVVETARELEEMGVRAITSDCGYMLHFQRQVAAALHVPVIMSSLIQIPLLERTIGGDQKIGVICANKKKLTPDLLDVAGVKDCDRIEIRGMEDKPYFSSPILAEEPELDSENIEKEMIETASELVQHHPEISSIVLECSNMPPYAHAIQRAINRPVFDFTTLINLFHGASFRKPFNGFY
ncbi:MAG: aspartate/glutamate racemase family protein [Desulfobulbaceae bacterium]|nr:aspartate/glutamate racemase family protein [Desulfobulbaceae bacterium]